MYRVSDEDELQILSTPTEKLMELPIIQNVVMQNVGYAYMIA